MFEVKNELTQVTKGTALGGNYQVIDEGDYVFLGLVLASFEAKQRNGSTKTIRFYKMALGHLDANGKVTDIDLRAFTDLYNKTVKRVVDKDGLRKTVYHSGDIVKKLDACARAMRYKSPEEMVAYAWNNLPLRQRVVHIESEYIDLVTSGDETKLRGLYKITDSGKNANFTADDLKSLLEANEIECLYGLTGNITVTSAEEQSTPAPTATAVAAAPVAPAVASNMPF